MAPAPAGPTPEGQQSSISRTAPHLETASYISLLRVRDTRITRFYAEVLFTNRAMLGVFEGAGFEVRRRMSFGELTVSLDLAPTKAVRERIDERDHFAAVASLRPLLAPSSIAVMGAASTPGNIGQAVLLNIVGGGFQGVVAPVNRWWSGGLAGGRSQSRRTRPRS